MLKFFENSITVERSVIPGKSFYLLTFILYAQWQIIIKDSL